MFTARDRLYRRHRFPLEIISYAVWLYFRFPLSLRMVEEMLAARGIGVSYETVRQWAHKFGRTFSDRIRQRAPARGDKWHLDEVVISIAGEPYWLWRGPVNLTVPMADLQQVVVNQQCDAYVLTRRFCTDCEGFRRIKDYRRRKIRTVFGRVEVRNPRIMNGQRCPPHCAAWTVLCDICPDQATPELMEGSARLGSLLPYRKAAEVMAEFLPIPSTESFVTLRHRTMKLGQRLDERARERAWFEPPSAVERRQMELNLPNDPEREFVVSIDTAHVRTSRTEAARNFEIVVARCSRGGRGSRPGRYFTTADTSKRELQSRTLQALQSEGYVGRGEVTVLSDGAEIMKRLPKALPQPMAHIIDWFHIAMKIQPLQQIADHVVRWHDAGASEMAHVDADVRSLKWKLWHGQTGAARPIVSTPTNVLGRSATSLSLLAHRCLISSRR